MTKSPESLPVGNYPEEETYKRGQITIVKGSPEWLAASQSVDFTIACYDKRTGGFGEGPDWLPTIFSTNKALEHLWWSHFGLDIEDAMSRFENTHGKNAFSKTVEFVSDNFHPQIEEKDGKETVVGGFLDPNDEVKQIDIITAHKALEALFFLEKLIGVRDAIATFEAEHPPALRIILNFVNNRWVQINKNKGGFNQRADSATPDVWGTHSALEIIALSTVHHPRRNPEEAAKWVKIIRERTPQFFEFLKDVESSYGGGYGFGKESPPNVLSMNQVLQIVDRLFFFNHPDPDNPDNLKDRQAFIQTHNFASQIERITDTIMACYDPATGGFKGYPV